ncbi:MAG TPA: hypothetical protein VFA48_01360 [Gammaproteobacteria bacterium]|nr:hypothetical protein [Gammaproteobacteria bacterium]
MVGALVLRWRAPHDEHRDTQQLRYAGRLRLALAPDRSAQSLCGLSLVESAVVQASSIVTDIWSGTASLEPRLPTRGRRAAWPP